MTPEQDRQLKEVYEFMKSMKRFEKIPLDVQMALSRKLGIRDVPRISVSSKSATSEDVTVNESGSSTYTVLNDPVGFVKLTDLSGNTYDIPYY